MFKKLILLILSFSLLNGSAVSVNQDRIRPISYSLNFSTTEMIMEFHFLLNQGGNIGLINPIVTRNQDHSYTLTYTMSRMLSDNEVVNLINLKNSIIPN